MTENDAIMLIDSIPDKIWAQMQRCEEEAIEMAYKALEEKSMVNEILDELREYREIGTVDDVVHYRDYYEGDVEYCGEYGTHDCQLRGRLERYEAIGTLEECRAAVEKQRAKKIFRQGYEFEGRVVYPNGINGVPYDLCPSCKTNLCTDGLLGRDKNRMKYCENCGQALDWRESEE